MRWLVALAVTVALVAAPAGATTLYTASTTEVLWCSDGVDTSGSVIVYQNGTPLPEIPRAQWTPRTPTPAAGQTPPCYAAAVDLLEGDQVELEMCGVGPTPTPLEAICCNCSGDIACTTAGPAEGWTCPEGCPALADCSCVATGPTWTATNTATRTATVTNTPVPVNTFTHTATATATATDTATPAGSAGDTFGSGSTLSGSWDQWPNTGPDSFDFSVTGGAAVPGGSNDTIAEWNANTPDASSNYAIIQLGSAPTAITGPMTGADKTPKDGAFCLVNATTMNIGKFDDGSAYIDNGGITLGFTATTGDWVAIVRTSPIVFSCYVCDASGVGGCNEASDWVLKGTDTMTGLTISNPGRWGIYGSATTATIAAFCAGNGTTLPAPDTCQ